MMKRHLVPLTLLFLTPRLALAAGGGAYAWETTLQKLITSLTGPVASGIGIGAIALFGLGLAFSEGGGLRTLIGIVFGLSIAFTATSLISSFFGFAGGAVW
jgi:type IV secretion system protein TrbC